MVAQGIKFACMLYYTLITNHIPAFVTEIKRVSSFRAIILLVVRLPSETNPRRIVWALILFLFLFTDNIFFIGRKGICELKVHVTRLGVS